MFLLKRAIMLFDFGMPLTKDNSEFHLAEGRHVEYHFFAHCHRNKSDVVNLGHDTLILMWQEAESLGHSSWEVSHGSKAAAGRGVVKVTTDPRGATAADFLMVRASAAHGGITFDIHLKNTVKRCC